jgi:hypothetical protein
MPSAENLKPGKPANSEAERRFQSSEEQTWQELVRGLEQDVKEFRHFTSAADFEQISPNQCRVTNGESRLSVTLTADLYAHTIHYEYRSTQERVAAPEGGLLSMRGSDQHMAADLYSSDQHLTSEQARRLILEPLLFPATRSVR